MENYLEIVIDKPKKCSDVEVNGMINFSGNKYPITINPIVYQKMKRDKFLIHKCGENGEKISSCIFNESDLPF